MAKDKGGDGGKSEAFPGGVKASDLPASVGGTKETAGESHAPVTTDAAARTPPPDTMPGPGKDDGPKTGGVLPEFGGPGGFVEHKPEAPKHATAADFADCCDGFADAIKAGNIPAAFKAAAAATASFADVMDNRGYAGAKAKGAADDHNRIGLKLATARNELSARVNSARLHGWHGGDPAPESGSPPVVNRNPDPRDAGAIDPQTILVLFELVQKMWETIRNLWR